MFGTIARQSSSGGWKRTCPFPVSSTTCQRRRRKRSVSRRSIIGCTALEGLPPLLEVLLRRGNVFVQQLFRLFHRVESRVAERAADLVGQAALAGLGGFLE